MNYAVPWPWPALVLMCNSHSLSLMPFLRVLPKRREWLSPSQIIVQIPLLLTCNVKQVAFCVGYINGLDVGDTPRLYVSSFKFYLSHTRLYRDCITSSEMSVLSPSFRGEENELASLSVCECMCGCAYDVCCSPGRYETRWCHLMVESGSGGHTVKHVLWVGGGNGSACKSPLQTCASLAPGFS